MRPVYVIGAFIILGLGILIGYLLWGWWARPIVLPEKQGYDIFKDILTLVLAIGTIVIAAAGYLIYVLILKETKATAASAAEEMMQYSSTELLTYIGYTYWYDYHFRKTNDINDLSQAITLTERAYSMHGRQLDESKRERLICTIYNNLAYYYAERNLPKDAQIARKYAKYIEERTHKHSEDRIEWEDTIHFVGERYP